MGAKVRTLTGNTAQETLIVVKVSAVSIVIPKQKHIFALSK
jgi:hypothetical protein